jgi:hypothetical protein
MTPAQKHAGEIQRLFTVVVMPEMKDGNLQIV